MYFVRLAWHVAENHSDHFLFHHPSPCVPHQSVTVIAHDARDHLQGSGRGGEEGERLVTRRNRSNIGAVDASCAC